MYVLAASTLNQIAASGHALQERFVEYCVVYEPRRKCSRTERDEGPLTPEMVFLKAKQCRADLH